MKISHISINNFRQFYKENAIEFSTDDSKNITVIHGANGSGKTTLLNAFKWCFYGRTDFDTQNDNLLNEAAIHSAKIDSFVEMSVRVSFSHEETKYDAIRRQRFKIVSTIKGEPLGESELALDITDSTGETKRAKSPSKVLNDILPEDLQPYFFFNGERIEHIAGVNQTGLVQDAIKKLMGLTVVERATKHLKKVRKHYLSKLRSDLSDEQLEVHNKIVDLDERIESMQEKIDTSTNRHKVVTSELRIINEKLKSSEQSRGLQKEREALDRQVDDIDKDLREVNEEQKALLATDGFLILSSELIKKCNDIVEENRAKGILPYGIKEQFIDDRIEMGKCICGTEINPGSEIHSRLLKVRETAGNYEIDQAYTKISSLLRGYDDECNKFNKEYSKLSKSVEQKIHRRKEITARLDEITINLQNYDDQKVKNLEIERVDKQQEVQDIHTSIELMKRDLGQLKMEKKDLEKLKTRMEEQSQKQDIYTVRERVVVKLTETLEKLEEALALQVKESLSEKVDKTFQSIMRKDVSAKIDDDYRLQVVKSTASGQEYVVSEQSTGERQVTSLSFISSIISLAKERHSKERTFFQGGLYPLVMDSPFGSLDDDYREKVARGVARLADQVIMFVSNSQWNGQVKLACNDRVGKSYKLVFYSPKKHGNDDNDYIKYAEDGVERTEVIEASL